jgi:hypothetical protein
MVQPMDSIQIVPELEDGIRDNLSGIFQKVNICFTASNDYAKPG